ncbi:hypothetical protein niasHT_031001 [Heterodera trifolii]|uniref:Uncharacterized protein n=1 Tax=Heterodera trifolii TaxID=157864 RepID=A0ABD2I8K3_9BILA
MLLEKDGEEYNDMAIYVQELTKGMEEAKSQIREYAEMTKRQNWNQIMKDHFASIKIEKANLQIRELETRMDNHSLYTWTQCKPYFNNRRSETGHGNS